MTIIPEPSSPSVHNVMAANKGTNTGPEMTLRRSLRARGVTGYRLNRRAAGVRIDIAFPSRRVAVLVNGCFWHHCPVCNLPIPKRNSEYWRNKFARNAERDRLNWSNLKAAGWSVVVIWEHELEEAPRDCARRVEEALEGVRRIGPVGERVRRRVLKPRREAA